MFTIHRCAVNIESLRPMSPSSLPLSPRVTLPGAHIRGATGWTTVDPPPLPRHLNPSAPAALQLPLFAASPGTS